VPAAALFVAHVPPVNAASRPVQVWVASAADLDREVAEDPLALARTVAGGWLRWIAVTAGARATSESETLDVPAETVPVVANRRSQTSPSDSRSFARRLFPDRSMPEVQMWHWRNKRPGGQHD
jgi:hypothetical protein